MDGFFSIDFWGEKTESMVSPGTVSHPGPEKKATSDHHTTTTTF